jgi:hypothetical protein
MKKIGIVTWHYNPNYGGLLQAYALQETIKKIGYKPEFINYRHDLNTFKKRLIRRIKDIYMMLFRHEIYSGRRKKLKFVKNNLSVSPPCYSYDNLKENANKIYNAGVCGSDQIWSNNNGVNTFYYLEFLNQEKRISYAPSIGYNFIPDSIQGQFKEYVQSIKHLSIREEKGAEIIKSITGRDAKVVLDPSLLLTKTEWLKVIKGKERVSPTEKYILLYILGDNEEQVKYAKQLSRSTGYKLIALETKYGKIKDLEVINGDPFDFVELVNNASYVLTDSFHGVAFSINFEKQFAVFKRFKDDEKKSQNSRIYNILNKTKLIDRLITADRLVSFIEQNSIDYKDIRPLLEAERQYSLDFLTESIKDIVGQI